MNTYFTMFVDIAEQTKLKLTEMEGGNVDHKERIDLLKQIENAIIKEKQIEEEGNKVKEVCNNLDQIYFV